LRWCGDRTSEAAERIEDDLRDDEPRVVLVVCGHGEPGRMARAGLAQALLEGLHVLLQNLRSWMSARLNFQFFLGSSMRARKRFRCSSAER